MEGYKGTYSIYMLNDAQLVGAQSANKDSVPSADSERSRLPHTFCCYSTNALFNPSSSTVPPASLTCCQPPTRTDPHKSLARLPRSLGSPPPVSRISTAQPPHAEDTASHLTPVAPLTHTSHSFHLATATGR